MPWGDYGNILFRGFLNVMDKQFHDLEVPEMERTGPFIPNIYIANTRDLVIADEIKRDMERGNITGAERFKPIKIKKIVNIDWQKWDSSSANPGFFPKSGEPEDYILRGKNDDILLGKTKAYWNPIIIEQKVLQIISDKKDKVHFSHLKIQKEITHDIVVSLPHIIVSENLKDILSKNSEDSIRFIEIS